MNEEHKRILRGRAGVAEPITATSLRKDQDATLAAWLLTLPHQAAWSHYMLGIVHLRPIEGVKPPTVTVPGAEHELLMVALNPKSPPNPEDLETLHHLTPANVVQQLTGLTDELAIQVATKVALALVDGYLPAEPSGIHGAKDLWKQSLEATAAHARTGGASCGLNDHRGS